MKQEEILSKLQIIFDDVFGDDSNKVKMETTSDDIDQWDSLAHINLIMKTEELFGVKFALGEIANLNNVGDLVNTILRAIEDR